MLLRTVYQEIIRLHFADEPISAASVLNAIGSDYEPVIKQALDFSAFARSDLPFYAGVLMEQSCLGQVRHAAAELAASETMDAANDAMAALNGLMVTKSSVQVVDSGEAAADFFARLGSSPEYLKWNIPDIDAKVYAEPGDLILLGGYPSSGKTLLAVQLALSMSRALPRRLLLAGDQRAETDRPHHVASEPGRRLRRSSGADLNEAEWAALADASTKFDALPFSIVPAAGFSVHDIQAVARNRKFQIIFVDYLQIINEKGKDRFDKVSNISLGLHTFSQESKIAVIALSQLSRPEKESGKPKPPTMASFRESGQIEQDADVAFILYPSNPDDNASSRILKVAKNKEGEKAIIELDFDGATQTMRVHEKTLGEHYREVHKAIAAAGKGCAGQVKFTEIKNDPNAPV